MLYQSEVTQFLNQLKKDNPMIQEKQQQGRALLWDKPPISLEEQKRLADSQIMQTPYVYY